MLIETNDQQKSSEQNGLLLPDYTNWLPTIQQIRELRWELTAENWKEKRLLRMFSKNRLLPFKVVVKELDISVFWFTRMRLASTELRAFSEKEFREFWDEKFRWIFNSPLEEYSLLAQNKVVDQCAWLQQTEAYVDSPELSDLYDSIAGVSYSAFTTEEIEYLRTKLVIEFGCGSGHLLSKLPESALGIDFDEPRIMRLADKFQWTRELLDSGRLIIGGPELWRNEEYAANRTLVISWPTYGRRGPVRALEEFTKAGGKFFVLKYGLYVDWRIIKKLTANLFLRASAGKSFRRLVTILADHWLEAPPEGQPEYNALALGDNPSYWVRKDNSSF